MVKATTRAAVILAALTITVAAGQAAAEDLPAVVLHVRDYAHLCDLASAQDAASAVYAHAGIRLVWTDGYAAKATADGGIHFDVVILTAAMTARRRPPAAAFGQASSESRYAFIHASRIIAHAMATGSDPDRVLGLVLAHEIGHMLLPGDGHASSGLMREAWAGRIAAIPDFLPAQALLMRARLVGASRIEKVSAELRLRPPALP
jgi:hypothetical protein